MAVLLVNFVITHYVLLLIILLLLTLTIFKINFLYYIIIEKKSIAIILDFLFGPIYNGQ